MRNVENRKTRSDEQLMEQFYAGRHDAFGVLADQLRPSLQRQAFAQLPTGVAARRQLAEDLVEDALVKVFETFRYPHRRWRPGGAKVRSWMGTILRNVVVSHLRRTGKERLFGGWSQESADGSPESFEDTIADFRLDAERQALATAAMHREFVVALDRLSAEERSIVKMRIEGKTFKTIGQTHDMAASTAMRRMESAEAAIRKIVAA